MRDKSAVFVFVVALGVYLLTLAPGMTWAHYGQDGGDLITAAVTMGVPHPSGYATYTLLGKLWSYLPLGTVAYRFNLFSAVCMAGAAAMVALYCRRDMARHVPTAAGLSFAFAPLVWSQAIITEVYALNLLVLGLLLVAAGGKGRPFLVGLLWGLSMTTHLTSALWLPFVAWQTRGCWHKVAPGVGVGLLPLLALFALARTDSPVNWFDPATLENWWFVVSGAIYRPNVFSHPIMPRLGEVIVPGLGQFGFVGWVFVGLGLTVETRREETQREERGKKFLLVLVGVLYVVYALKYDTPDAAVFVLPGLLIAAVLLGDGLQKVGWLGLLLPIALVLLNFSEVNLHGDTLARTRMMTTAQTIAPNAVVLAPGDQTIFTLWYYHYVEEIRPDIIPIDENLFQFDWYRARLGQLYPDLRHWAADDLPGFIVVNGAVRPVCFVSLPRGAVDCD